MPHFSIGQRQRERLIIDILRRSYPDSTDYWDGNWLDAHIRIAAGGFKGAFNAFLRAEDFVHLRSSFERLYTNLSGQFEFEAMEEQITFKVTGDGKGHFSVDCTAVDEAGTGNRLECVLSFDQTDIPTLIQQLDEVIKQFPVQGQSSA